MIIRKHKIQKGKFELAVERMDLSQKGIYLIRGGNGSGKTSFIESVLKQNQIEDISQTEKTKYISYFSQRLYPYETSGNKYLEGCDPTLIQEYCRYFSFELLEKDITYLSGGEFVVLSLIRCFSRGTPIMVLDEPTNNLDDATVKKVISLLEELSMKKTIIVSTHDERLNLQHHSALAMGDGTAKLTLYENDGTKPNTEQPGSPLKIKTFRSFCFSKFNGLMFAVVLFCGLLTSMFASNYLANQVPDMEKLPDDDVINMMWIAEEVATYIEATKSPAEIIKNFKSKTDTMSTDELVTLSKKSYIEDIYVIDTGYLAKLQEGTSDDLRVFSIPYMTANHPLHFGAYPGCKKYLLSGRLPQDGKSEALISFEQMQKHFGYSGDINDVIGQTIKIEGGSYEVVGLTGLPYVSISFDPDTKKQYGTILVSEQSVPALTRILEQMKDLNYGSLVFEDIFIKYQPSAVDELMDYLVEHAPSYQYSSSYVDLKIETAMYLDLLPKLLLLSLVLSILLSGILIILGSKMFLILGNQIQDMNNRNLLPKKNFAILIGVFAVDFLIMTAACLVEGVFFMESWQRWPQMAPFIFTNIIVFGLALGLIWKRYKKNA